MKLGKVTKVESQVDYERTVPTTARLANEEKVCEFQNILRALTMLTSYTAERDVTSGDRDITIIERNAG